MMYPISIKDWKQICCENPNWKIVKITVDKGLGDRLRTVGSKIIEESQYLVTLKCQSCGFQWTKYFSKESLHSTKKKEAIK